MKDLTYVLMLKDVSMIDLSCAFDIENSLNSRLLESQYIEQRVFNFQSKGFCLCDCSLALQVLLDRASQALLGAEPWDVAWRT